MNMACLDIRESWYFRVDLSDLHTVAYILAMQ